MSLNRLDFLLETGKVSYSYFQTNIAHMVLKVVQDHWRYHNSTGHKFAITLFVLLTLTDPRARNFQLCG